VKWGKGRVASAAETDRSERERLIADIRRAEQEWKTAEWRFHYAREADHIDYAIYCLEAAEKKLDMLLRQAKLVWNPPGGYRGGEDAG
jgi:hypothetical protein